MSAQVRAGALTHTARRGSRHTQQPRQGQQLGTSIQTSCSDVSASTTFTPTWAPSSRLLPECSCDVCWEMTVLSGLRGVPATATPGMGSAGFPGNSCAQVSSGPNLRSSLGHEKVTTAQRSHPTAHRASRLSPLLARDPPAHTAHSPLPGESQGQAHCHGGLSFHSERLRVVHHSLRSASEPEAPHSVRRT